MKPIDEFDLDAADVERLDAIVTRRSGRGLLAETRRWRQQRRCWLAAATVALSIIAATLVIYHWPV